MSAFDLLIAAVQLTSLHHLHRQLKRLPREAQQEFDLTRSKSVYNKLYNLKFRNRSIIRTRVTVFDTGLKAEWVMRFENVYIFADHGEIFQIKERYN